MEEKIRIPSGDISLEGLLSRADGTCGVVITHPHPLYGGDMFNPVVESIQQTYRAHGFTTLRFNFRGTGDSEGHYEGGTGETNDVRAALATMAELGIERIDLAGYSFGAWVNAHVPAVRPKRRRSIMVSPPVAFVGFTGIDTIPDLHLVVTGSRDEIAPAEEIRPMLGSWNPAAVFEIIEGADHFYFGHMDRLQEVLSRHIPPGGA